MKSFKEFEGFQKRNVDFMQTSTLKESVENPKPGDEDYPAKDAFKKAARTAKKILNSHKKSCLDKKVWKKKIRRT